MTIAEPDYEWAGGFEERDGTDCIVLHHAAAEHCTALEVHRWHLARGWTGIGYHYFVDKEGGVWRGRPETAVGAHCVPVNRKSIGVCFEGNFEDEEMGEDQLEAGLELVQWLLSRFRGAQVKCHRDFDATACPGEYFPERAFTDEPSDWAQSAADWAVEKGLIQGDGTAMNWRSPVTREELAVILKRWEDGRG